MADLGHARILSGLNRSGVAGAGFRSNDAETGAVFGTNPVSNEARAVIHGQNVRFDVPSDHGSTAKPAFIGGFQPSFKGPFDHDAAGMNAPLDPCPASDEHLAVREHHTLYPA